MARCRKGDLAAFEALYRRHRTALYNLVYRMVGNLSDAEDLLQEIFLLAYNKLPTFKGQSALGTWLYRLAVNRCLDHLRSRASRNQAVTESLEQREESGRTVASRGEPAPSQRIDLERAISRLPQSYRAAFLLYDVEGLEHREVGAVLGIAEGTSKSLVHKARLKIRDWLRQQPVGGRP